MSHLWMKDADGAWRARPLEADLVVLRPGATKPSVVRRPPARAAAPVLARTGDGRGDERWALLCAPGSRTRVNGTPVPAGVRVLADRDSIVLGDGRTVFFSCERLAEIVPFRGEDDHTCCIRCKLPLEPGASAVRCPAPGCGFWHHQCGEQPCWTYTDGCASCGHPTAFDAGFQWTPAAL